MQPRNGNRYAAWFCRAVWAGVVVNVLLALPTLIAPQQILSWTQQMTAPEDSAYVRMAALFLLALSAFYVPAGLDPDRYRASAWLTVLARAAGVAFFFLLWPGVYPLFGAIDLAFLIVQAPLLWLTRSVPADLGEPAVAADG